MKHFVDLGFQSSLELVGVLAGVFEAHVGLIILS